MKILALDLGKFNTMCCFFDTRTRKHSFLNAATDRSYLTTVFKQQKLDLVVMEACGPSGWINDLAQSQGLQTIVCSTNEDAWKWSNVKRKTDKDDALKLARMASMHQRSRQSRTPTATTLLASAGHGFLDCLDPLPFNEHRPHMSLGGRTPDEVYFARKPANRRPRGSPCARPQTLVQGKCGQAFDLVVTFPHDQKHLPIVTLSKRAA